MKRTFQVSSMCTKCNHCLIDMFNNELEVFKSTQPHPCKHGLDIFDAKIFMGKATKTHTRVVIDPAKLAPPASSVYSTAYTCMERRLQTALEAYDKYNQATKILLTVIHMDFPAVRTHNSISPEEAGR